MLVKLDVFGVEKHVKEGTKRSSGPKTDFVGQQQTGRGRYEAETAGVKKFSSFIWTLMVKHKKMEKGKGMGWANSEGVV